MWPGSSISLVTGLSPELWSSSSKFNLLSSMFLRFMLYELLFLEEEGRTVRRKEVHFY